MSIDEKVQKKRNVRLQSMWFRVVRNNPSQITLLGRRNDSKNDKPQHTLFEVTNKAKYFLNCYFKKRGFTAVAYDSELASYGMQVPTFEDAIPYYFDKGGRPIFRNSWLGQKSQDILAGADTWQESVSASITLLYPQCWGGIIQSLEDIDETPREYFLRRLREDFEVAYEKDFIERHCVRIQFFVNNNGIPVEKRRNNFQSYIRGWSHIEKKEKEEEDARQLIRSHDFYKLSKPLNKPVRR